MMRDKVRLVVEPQRVVVNPGSSSIFQLTVFNAGETVEEFDTTVVGIDDAWFRATPQVMQLLPGASGTVQATISVPETARLQAGSMKVGFRVRAVNNHAVARVEEASLDVQGINRSTLVLEPRTARGGRKARLTARIQNDGTVVNSYTLRGDDPEQAVTFEFQPTIVTVQPHEQGVSRVKLRASPPWTGSAIQRVVTVSAEGADDVRAQATLIQNPRIGRFAGRVIGAAVAAAALVIATSIPAVRGGIRDLFRGEEPAQATEQLDVGEQGSAVTVAVPDPVTIAAFVPSGAPDPSGCTSLSWVVRGADTVSLDTPTGGTFEVPAEGSQEVCGSTGDVATLTAVGEGGSDQKMFTFSPDLAVLGDVEITLNGPNPVFSVATNMPSDVQLLFAGTTADSAGKLTHTIELDGLASGTGGQWSLTASASGQEDIVFSGDFVVPFFYARATIVDGPVFTPTPVATTTTTLAAPGGGNDVVFVLPPGGVLANPDIKIIESWTYVYTTAPVQSFLGDRDCPQQYIGELAEELIFEVTPGETIQLAFGGGRCSAFFVFADLPIPAGISPSQPKVVLAPDQDTVTSDVTIMTANGSIDVRIQLERVLSDTPLI